MHTHPTTSNIDVPRRLNELKRNAYLFVLSVGIVALLVSRSLEDAIDPFERLSFPLLAGWLAVALVVTLFAAQTHARMLRFVETFIHTGIAVFFLLKFAYTLFWAPPDIDIAYEFLESSVWVLTVYMIAFLIFDTRRGARWSLTYYALFAGLGLVRFVFDPGIGTEPGDFGAVIQYYIATGAFIAILFTFGRIKAAYIRADVEATVSKRMANTDFLTRLPNRRRMTELLEQEIERSKRYDRSLSIILFDLDRFKRVNDAHGHDVGDAVLQEVAVMVTRNLRSADHVGRWGGEEFLIIVPEVGLGSATQQAERLRQHLAAYVYDDVGTVTASFGVASYHRGESLQDLLRRADTRLLQAKEHGRNQVRPVL